MPDLYLIAADAALRAAVAEQLALAALGEVHEHASLPAGAPAAGPDALILDAPAANDRTLKALREWQAQGRKPRLFILGDAETAFNESLAAEFFPKPLRLGHLLARLQFRLRPAAQAPGGALVFAGFRLEPQARQAVALDTGAVIRLTEKETELLEYLGRSENPVGREELLASIWGYDARIDTHTLETHIYRLRRKLDPEGGGDQPIVAEQGAYRLAARRRGS